MKSAKRGLRLLLRQLRDQVGWNRGNDSSRPYVCTAGMGESFLLVPKTSADRLGKAAKRAKCHDQEKE